MIPFVSDKSDAVTQDIILKIQRSLKDTLDALGLIDAAIYSIKKQMGVIDKLLVPCIKTTLNLIRLEEAHGKNEINK